MGDAKFTFRSEGHLEDDFLQSLPGMSESWDNIEIMAHGATQIYVWHLVGPGIYWYWWLLATS